MEGKIVCCLKSCQKQITASQPSMACWLCDNVVHVKCVGYSGLVADAIAKRTGLNWCCESCREVECEMRMFMRQTRVGFTNLIGGFHKLNDQFSALNSQFNSLKLMAESPKRKKSTSCDLQLSKFLPLPSTDPPTTPLVPQLISFATPVATTAAESIPIREPAPPTLVNAEVVSEVSTVVTRSRGKPNPNKKISSAPPPTVGSPTLLGSKDNIPNITPLAPKPLVGVPPMKQIFVSRLAPDLTSDDVKAFIIAKIKNANPKVEKFKFAYDRQIASFKINVPPSLFETICSPSFWPEHLVVKEFKAKVKNRTPIGLLPNGPVQSQSQSSSSSSKN